MSGGGMSFHLRMWDFSLDAVLSPAAIDVNENARTLRRGGKITDEGELESDHRLDNLVLRNVSSPLFVVELQTASRNESLIYKLLPFNF